MKPPWASPIWIDADFIHMELPSPVPGAPSTTVKFVRDDIGLAQALRVLGARQRDWGEATVSTKAAPTQLQLDAARRRSRPPPRPTAATNANLREVAQSILKRMGLV